jgi:hypothetical protein
MGDRRHAFVAGRANGIVALFCSLHRTTGPVEGAAQALGSIERYGFLADRPGAGAFPCGRSAAATRRNKFSWTTSARSI